MKITIELEKSMKSESFRKLIDLLECLQSEGDATVEDSSQASLEDLPPGRVRAPDKEEEETKAIKKADKALAAAKRAEEKKLRETVKKAEKDKKSEAVDKVKNTKQQKMDDKTFAGLGLNSMEAVLSIGENITPFRAGAFARLMQKEYGKKVVDLAKSLSEEGFKGIKKDPVTLAVFVQKLIDKEWTLEAEESNDFE